MTHVAILIPTKVDENIYLQDANDNLYTAVGHKDPMALLTYVYENNKAVRISESENQLTFRSCDITLFDYKSGIVPDTFALLLANSVNGVTTPLTVVDEVSEEQKELLGFIKTSPTLKPSRLKLTDIKWKYLIRNVLRGKNCMLTGETGCGKTLAVQSLQSAFPNRKFFYLNLGSTQDPRSALIGSTHFSKDNGTFFSESYFVKAIQTEDAIILLDEISRAHPEAMNILMPVLDEGQRYLRLDEADGAPTIKVAKGVSFIGTANIGNQYTATRVMDRALMDRFTIVEFEALTLTDETSLLKELFPELNIKKVQAVAEIADLTRKEVKSETSKISTSVSTRLTIELAGLLNDGFTIAEAAEVAIFPFYGEEGGLDSERTFIKQVVQKYFDLDKEEKLFSADDTITVGTDSLANVKPF